MKAHCFAGLIWCAAAFPALSQSHDHGTHDHSAGSQTSPYAGFEGREIKSLSATDIAELRDGGGWGLALPAELNGRPGPAHLLELKQEIGLTPDQIKQIEALYVAMKSEAQAAGEHFIAAEAALNEAFTRDDLDESQLRELVDASSKARADLRFVHLKQHLATTPILSEIQIKTYNQLRGYASNPCDEVPEGHNPEMWRKHNGCD